MNDAPTERENWEAFSLQYDDITVGSQGSGSLNIVDGEFPVR